MKDIDLSPVTRSRVRAVLLLAALGALFFIPGIGGVHLFDWDEANFAEASREMIASGDYTRVTIDYRPFYEKPPLFFWLQAASMHLFGVNEFAARFVNACCGIVTLAALFLIGSRIAGPLFGFLWALAFFGSFLPHIFFKSGIIDPVFNLLIVLGLIVSVRALLDNRAKRRLLLFALSGLLIGLAMLAKGPVALLVFGLTALVYWVSVRFRPFAKLREIVVFLAAAGAVASLFFGVETLSHGTSFVRSFVVYQIRLFSTGDAGQGRPFYFHFFVILLGCFPASFFAIGSFVRRAEASARERLYNRFMLILFWVVLVLFSIVKTKTILYSSLTWFPVTYLAALGLSSLVKENRSPGKPLRWALVAFVALAGAVMTLFPVLLLHKEWIVPLIPDKFALGCLENPVHWSGTEFLLGLGYLAAAGGSLFLLFRRRPALGTVGLFGSTAVCLFLFSLIYTAKIEQYCQGGPIAFYEQHGREDVYTRSLFKSYIDLFYSRVRRDANPLSRSREWLLRGPIDKPVYLVCRVTEAENYDRDTTLDLVKLKTEYGFTYYKRDPRVLIAGQEQPGRQAPPPELSSGK